MLRTRVINTPALATLLLAAAYAQDAPDTSNSAAPAQEVSQKASPTDRVTIARSAAPASVADRATIMDFDNSGKLVQLEAGTNGWVCLPDDAPAAPGDSPNCMDARWLAFFEAYEKKQTPKIDGVGVAYMLQGSSSPSNSDPFAEKPAPGSDWIKDGPHVMLILPDPKQLDTFPSEHTSGGPYVMFKGTPYAHLMMPVPGK